MIHCSHSATFPRHPAIQFKDKSERSVLLLLFTHFVEFCHSLGCGTLQSVAILETVLTFLVLPHYKYKYKYNYTCVVSNVVWCVCRAVCEVRCA